jgi:hypothetical protein
MKARHALLFLALAANGFGEPAPDARTGLRDGESLRLELKHIRLYGDLQRRPSLRPKRRHLFYEFDYCITLASPARSKRKPRQKCTFLNKTGEWEISVQNQDYATTATRPFSTLDWGTDGPTWTVSAQRLAAVAKQRNPKNDQLASLRVRLRARGFLWWSNTLAETELQLPARARGAWPIRIDAEGYSSLDPKPLDAKGKEAEGGLTAMILNEDGEPAPSR